MNKVQFHIKENGEWVKLNATPVFPFSVGELLDERLDEAYMTVYDSPVQHYARLTDIRATIYNGENTPKAEYFIIASDNSVELPAGSGKYKHDIYLIERTKMLEGIFCSSITFTNSRGNGYSKTAGRVYATGTAPQQVAGFYGVPEIITPISNLAYTPPSSRVVAEAISEASNLTHETFKESATAEAIINTGTDQFPEYVTYYTYLRITSGDIVIADNVRWDTSYPLSQDILSQYESIKFTYYCCAQRNSVAGLLQYTRTAIFDVKIASNRPPLKRWSITDCVIRACELAIPLFGTEAPRYRLDGVEYDGNGEVIKPYTAGSLAEKYDKIFAPEFTLTQDTLREQLRVIFSYVHAEPWLDENDVIQVTEYGGVTQSASAGLPYVYAGAKSHINEYCTEVRSHAQNLASSLGYAKGTMIDPGNGLYRSTRTDVAYTRITEGNGIAATNKPIYSIEKVMCGIANPGGTWYLSPVDITPYVFEATEYGANLSPHKGGFPYSRAYAIYYTIGQPNIQGLFYQAPDAIDEAKYSPFSICNILSAVTGINVDDIYNRLKETGGAADLVFSVTYKPISNHFVSHGKSLYIAGEKPFIQLYNQSENLVESQYYGENLKGVAARLGNVEKERTFILKDINDVPRVGELLGDYAITTVSNEIYPFDIKCTVGLSKDFNRISEYVGINSQKRMYEVSERQATQRDILIKETLVIGSRPDGYISSDKFFGNLKPFYDVFDAAIENTGAFRISFAWLRTKKKNQSEQATVSLPVIGRALGNVLTFNFATKDNYSAGDSTVLINGDNNVRGRWQTDVPYSNYYGRSYWADVFLRSKSNGTALDIINGAYLTPGDTPPSEQRIYIPNHRLRKDNRESLSYNLELEIKTTVPDLIIGSALAELSGWVNDTDVNPVMYFFDASKYAVSKFDMRYTPHEDDIEGHSYESNLDPNPALWSITNEADGTLNFRTVGQSINGRGVGFVLCTPIETVTETVEDEDGEIEEITYQTGGDILLANNGPFDFGETISYDFYVTKD